MGPWLLYSSSISVVNIDTFDDDKSRTVFLYSIQPNILMKIILDLFERTVEGLFS